MRIAICDDDVILCHQLEGIILGFGKNEDVPVQTSVFFDGKGLWKYMKQGNHFDLIFLDIEMEQMNGIAVGRAIRDTLGDEECKIVFISSRRDYAMELFAIRPMDFMSPIRRYYSRFGEKYGFSGETGYGREAQSGLGII